jgi:hypothetical protein
VLADIEVADLAPRGGGDVDAPPWVDGARDRIGHVDLAGPLVEPELAAGTRGRGGLGGVNRSKKASGEREAEKDTGGGHDR